MSRNFTSQYHTRDRNNLVTSYISFLVDRNYIPIRVITLSTRSIPSYNSNGNWNSRPFEILNLPCDRNFKTIWLHCTRATLYKCTSVLIPDGRAQRSSPNLKSSRWEMFREFAVYLISKTANCVLRSCVRNFVTTIDRIRVTRVQEKERYSLKRHFKVCVWVKTRWHRSPDKSAASKHFENGIRSWKTSGAHSWDGPNWFWHSV